MPKKNRCLLCVSSLCIFLMLVGEWKTKRFISELPGKVAAGQETVRCSETREEGLSSMQEGFLLFFGLDVERQWYNTFILTLSLPWFHLKTTSKSAISSTIKPFFPLFFVCFCISMWKDFHQNTQLMMSWCLMSSDVSWHIRDKLWPMPKHGSIILYVHGNQKAR